MVEKDDNISSCFDSADIGRCVRILKKIDFELAYLALLTHDGIKPLSRWEKELDNGGLEALQEIELSTKQVRRTSRTGKEVIETIFSRTPAYIQLYEQRFENHPIDKTAETQRFEGFLFGYPPCSVNRFISRPYTPNGLNPQEQKIFFHWACKDCKVTPSLIRYYESIHTVITNS